MFSIPLFKISPCTVEKFLLLKEGHTIQKKRLFFRLVLTPHYGVQIDRNGNYKKKWRWHFIKGHVHTPPFQPICFALNKEMSCRIMEQVSSCAWKGICQESILMQVMRLEDI